MTGNLLGYRKDGSPIRLVWGGADDDPEPPPPGPGAPVASQGAEELAAMRAELEAARAEAAQNAERLRALMAGNEPAAPADDDDPDDDPDNGKPIDPELLKARRALRAANKESKARREAAERMKAEWDAQDAAHKSQVAEAQKLAEAAEAARLAAEAKYKPATIKAAAVPALLTAGAKPERADRLVKLLDLNALDVDANGEVTGLAAQVEAVKQEWPELFKSADDEQRRAPRVATGDRPPVQERPLTSAEKIARQVLGGAA